MEGYWRRLTQTPAYQNTSPTTKNKNTITQRPTMSQRRLPSWIDGYTDMLQDNSAPALSCKWVAIWTVAAALERRVKIFTDARWLYPNLYVFMVAPPGIGKTAAMIDSADFLRKLGNGRRLGAASMTSASLVDDLRETKRTYIESATKKNIDYYSLALSSNDLQVLLPAYDAGLLSKLTDLYDCHFYDESRRGNKTENSFEIQRPQLSLYAATTPGHLMGTFSEEAWGFGFMSRVIMVFTSEKNMQSLFDREVRNTDTLRSNLQHDLKLLSKVEGQLTFTPEAKKAIDTWHMTGPYGGKPVPTHPRLLNYCTRRVAHALKLSMVACIDRADTEMVITLADWNLALDWLLEAEDTLGDIFKEAVAGSDMTLAQDLVYYITEKQIKGETCTKATCLKFLINRTTAGKAEQLLNSMVQAGLLKRERVKGKGFVITTSTEDLH